jgi:hypothetical protein
MRKAETLPQLPLVPHCGKALVNELWGMVP